MKDLFSKKPRTLGHLLFVLSLSPVATLSVAADGSAGASPEKEIECNPTMTDGTVMKTAYQRPPEEELKQRLTPLQYHVTQKDGTEPAFHNTYWDNKLDGIYVDIVSGEPLFSSRDKYDSGTGWPSFHSPIHKENIVQHEDRSFFMTRTEVRSRHGDSHLGHLFDDGPAPTGLRYCINSASLRFVPVTDLKREGYTDYLALFDDGQPNKPDYKP